MDFFIRIKDGQPFEHPIFGDNFRQAFPDVDVNNLPSEFAKFEHGEKITIGVYEVLENPIYVLVDGICKSVPQKRDMTLEEKTNKQQEYIKWFNNREQAENWSAWTFDEAACTIIPPTPRPEPDQTKLDAGILTVWCGADNSWKDTPARPEGQYKFDFLAWQWVEITP